MHCCFLFHLLYCPSCTVQSHTYAFPMLLPSLSPLRVLLTGYECHAAAAVMDNNIGTDHLVARFTTFGTC